MPIRGSFGTMSFFIKRTSGIATLSLVDNYHVLRTLDQQRLSNDRRIGANHSSHTAQMVRGLLLGIHDCPKSENPQVNCNTASKVYTGATWDVIYFICACAEHGRKPSLDINAPHRNEIRQSDLPSWVPVGLKREGSHAGDSNVIERFPSPPVVRTVSHHTLKSWQLKVFCGTGFSMLVTA